MNDMTNEQTLQHRITEGLKDAADDVDALMKSGLQQGDAQVQALRDRVASRLRRARLQLDELEEAAIHRARHAARVVDDQVHEHPYAAIGIAAAVGALAGLLVALSRRD